MSGKSIKLTILFFTALFLSIISPAFLYAADALYDAPGFDPNRETFSSMPNENIDPFTGGLVLTFEDIRLPGNGGLDLVVQRTFNSKSTCRNWTSSPGSEVLHCTTKSENTWLGYGWTLHMGRLFYQRNNPGPHPIIEMPDGSRHTAYNAELNWSDHFHTKDYWQLSHTTLTLPNGTKIYYEHSGDTPPEFFLDYVAYYATKIQDVHGNEINIYYKSNTSEESDQIDYIIDSLGRRIDFNTSTINGSKRLTSITGPGVSITYTHTDRNSLNQYLPEQETLLIEAKPPVGNPWRYGYVLQVSSNTAIDFESDYELSNITTPSGGIINYTYALTQFQRSNPGIEFLYKTVNQKDTSGTIPAGTWTFAYSQGANKDYTEVHDSCGRTTRYGYYGYGNTLPAGSMWMLGLQKYKEIVGEETNNFTWSPSNSISPDNYTIPAGYGADQEIYVPLLSSKSITRDGKTYTATNSNYDAYGNPQTIAETGDKTRNRALTYWYNTSKNIVQGKVLTETVTGGFPGTFTTTNTYETATGNLTQTNKYGVVTNYTYYTNGNIQTHTDANSHTASYEWQNGRISKVTNPIYAVSRVINSNGTVASETNGRGFTTSYTYDGNLRVLSITPPVGNATTFTYPADNSYKQETRGQYWTTTYNDGFGRPTDTTDIKGVVTQTVYTACDLKDYTTSNIGDTTYFDNFGRVEQIVHQDSNDINYAYSQSNVTVTDEANKTTALTYNAFGNPDEKLLVGVTDANSKTATYNYNILGSLTTITKGGITRSFVYNTKNFLTSETHPEKGTISYGRDNIGNLASKTDSLGATSYAYDAINRLTTINYGTGTVNFTYDNANNRQTMNNGSSSSTYTYDVGNRLTKKAETILGKLYTTQYGYDANDNLTSIDYPTGFGADYTYNNKNQVTSLTSSGANVTNMTYYTSGSSIGLPQSYTYSNGLVTNLAYSNRNLATGIDVLNGSTPVLDITYAYDIRGNMSSLTDNIDPMKNQAYGYDNLNRLTSFKCHNTGNRNVLPGMQTTYSYTNQRLVSTTPAAAGGDTFAFSYNGSGDVTQVTKEGVTNKLVFDRLHNVTSYTDASDTPIASFAYDGDGMRVIKTTPTKTIVYHYGVGGNILSETDQTGAVITDYVYLNGKMVAKKTATEGVSFYHTDPAGTPIAMTASNGGIVWQADYLPFGEENEVAGTVENDKKFVGKEKDEESGLYYFGARYMEAMIGRFVSPDPVGLVDSGGKINAKILINPQRLNIYAYALNNPFVYIDRDGNYADTVIDVISIGVSLNDLRRDPKNVWNWVAIGADAVCLALPVAAGGGLAVKALTKADDVVDAVKAGKTVLGKYPDYIKLADKLEAKSFNIPANIWNKMSEAERWTANQKFLDRMINRGDDILLSNPVKNINEVSGTFKKELNYLTQKGYKLSDGGTKLIK